MTLINSLSMDSIQGHRSVARAGRRILFASVIAIFGLAAQSVSAAPINLPPLLEPIIFSNFGTTNYDSTTDAFQADAFATTVTFGGSSENIGAGSFSLTANISAGGVLNSGSLTIAGTAPAFGFNSGTLLVADVLEIGFENGNDAFEFRIDPTGGDLKPLFDAASSGGNGGIKMFVTGYNSDDFNSDFSNGAFNSFNNTGAIPVPAAVWLFGSALLGLFGLGRKKSAR